MAPTQSKAVLITGCSTGIGRATAQHLAEKGWTGHSRTVRCANGVRDAHPPRASRAVGPVSAARSASVRVVCFMIESMSAYRGIRATFGRVPGDVDDERLVETWVDVCLAFAREHGLD